MPQHVPMKHMFRLLNLHQQYGPVVQITPWEIHIKGPNYYSHLDAGPGIHCNKDPWFGLYHSLDHYFQQIGTSSIERDESC
ncbi:hypothetical protein N7474_009597 [Penicillium riverlandense]|uniref:uncharacterized protein n=1 Tax=Penicillium riverlandense TaxID=1903569 RepID=UPI00254930CB|nr:uncharacterized protein N7474_009597 [Penicillium riverlandense]KAJ5808328.1 hypothetical protein N7474_009597 [Penicillium riverlandense]